MNGVNGLCKWGIALASGYAGQRLYKYSISPTLGYPEQGTIGAFGHACSVRNRGGRWCAPDASHRAFAGVRPRRR